MGVSGSKGDKGAPGQLITDGPIPGEPGKPGKPGPKGLKGKPGISGTTKPVYLVISNFLNRPFWSYDILMTNSSLFKMQIELKKQRNLMTQK